MEKETILEAFLGAICVFAIPIIILFIEAAIS
jgi:hypothetical protein